MVITVLLAIGSMLIFGAIVAAMTERPRLGYVLTLGASYVYFAAVVHFIALCIKWVITR